MSEKLIATIFTANLVFWLNVIGVWFVVICVKEWKNE